MSDQARVPVRHRVCGEVIGFYLRDQPRPNDSLHSEDYERIDGSKPVHGEAFRETCLHCLAPIYGTPEMERCFNEVQSYGESRDRI